MTSQRNQTPARVIDPSSGVITLAKALDYETQDSYTFTVTAASTDGITATQSYTITISDDTTEGPVIAIAVCNGCGRLRLMVRQLSIRSVQQMEMMKRWAMHLRLLADVVQDGEERKLIRWRYHKRLLAGALSYASTPGLYADCHRVTDAMKYRSEYYRQRY